MSFEHIKWAWNADKGLKSSEQLVLLALADRANKTGVCWPSIQTISDDTHLNRKTVIRCVNVLQHRGLVAVAKTHGDSNRYQLQKPPADLQPVLDYVEGVSIVAQGVVPNLPGVVPKTAPKPIINQSKPETTTAVEPVQVVDASLAIEKPDVVVQGSVDEKEPHQTKTQTANSDTRLGSREAVGGIDPNRDDCQNDHGGIGSVPGIDAKHQKAARKALERLTPEQAQAVIVAFTLQCSKSNISNRVGYLIRLVQSTIDGTFSPVRATGASPAMTLDERLARERQRQHEAQQRGKMTTEEHAAWLAETFGARPVGSSNKLGVRIGLRSMLGWA